MGRKDKTRRTGDINEHEFDSSDDDLYATTNSRNSSPVGPASRSHFNSIDLTTPRQNAKNSISTSNRSTKRNYQNLLIIEIKEIILEPSGMQLTSGSTMTTMNAEDSDFTFVYRIEEEEICIFMEKKKREIAISLDQFQNFQYTKERNLILTFGEKPNISYYEFPHGTLDYRILIPYDPTGGQLNNVTKIVFSISDSMGGESRRLIEEIKKWKKKRGNSEEQYRVNKTRVANEPAFENNNSNWTSQYNPGKTESSSVGNHRDQGNNDVLLRDVRDISPLDTDNHQMPPADNEVNLISSWDSSVSLLDTDNQIPQAADEPNVNLSRGSGEMSFPYRDIDNDVKTSYSPQKDTRAIQRARNKNFEVQPPQIYSESLLDAEIPAQSVHPNIFNLRQGQNGESDIRFVSSDRPEAQVSMAGGGNPQSSEEPDRTFEISGSTLDENEALLHVICTFLTRKYAMLMPFEATLQQLINDIEKNRKIKVSLSRLFYRNQINDKISIFDEDDWIIAKKEALITESYTITLFFA